MADDLGARARYRAFISYSHKDAPFATRLHRRLEAYVLPRGLGPATRLKPIFKDREELPAAQDLGEQVKAALERSDCLIVVCSPDAAASRWVAQEIETFRACHPEAPILAALVRAEPADGFPPTLLATGTEPLAADFRKSGDGERLAFLKLVAGITGIGLDNLVQRDVQQRLRRVTALTGAAVLVALVMAVMAAVALNARAEAEAQRLEAEALVEFMLTELREELKGAGDLRVRTVANRRALEYFSEQKPSSLSPSALQKRARLLHAIGEDEIERGRVNSAKIFFDQAYGLTQELLSRSPTDPDRIWAHAQSAYWQGRAAHAQRRLEPAGQSWREYEHLADQLLSVQPLARRSLLEVAYAENAQCALAVEIGLDAQKAIRSCRKAVEKMRRAALTNPIDKAALFDLATDHAWLADAYVLSSDLESAMSHRLQQIEIIDRLLAADPTNALLLDSSGAAQRALSKITYLNGQYSDSEKHMREARRIYTDLSYRDRENAAWQSQIEFSDRALERIISKKHEAKQ